MAEIKLIEFSEWGSRVEIDGEPTALRIIPTVWTEEEFIDHLTANGHEVRKAEEA